MEKHTALKEIKVELMKTIKWEDDVQVAVKIYDCDETGEQTYDVEINAYAGGEYLDTFVTDVAYEGELKLAERRAKSVLRTVKGWFEYHDDVTVEDGVTVYHM